MFFFYMLSHRRNDLWRINSHPETVLLLKDHKHPPRAAHKRRGTLMMSRHLRNIIFLPRPALSHFVEGGLSSSNEKLYSACKLKLFRSFVYSLFPFVRQVLADQQQVILKGVLEEAIDNNDNEATIKAKTFYKSCMDLRKCDARKANFELFLPLDALPCIKS